MSDLANQTPASTYKGLLQVGDYTDGVDSTVKAVLDGEGTTSALAISTTKVGVGTTSPSAELDVSGNVVADEYALDQTGSSSSAVAIHAPATNELAIRTNSTEVMRIDSSGQVGIGTTNPTSLLHVKTSGTGGTLVIESDDDGSASAPNFLLFRNSTTPAVNDNLGEIKFRGKNDDNPQSNIDYTMIRSGIKDPTNNSEKGELTFWTRGGATLNQHMVLDSDGNVGIGTTDPTSLLHVEGDEAIIKIRSTAAYSATTGPWLNFQGKNSAGTVKYFGGIKAYSAATDKGELAFNVRQSSVLTDVEVMRIDSEGNVGIGTTNPDEKLTIFAAVKPVIKLVGTGNNVANTNFGEIQFYNRDGSADGPNVAASIHAESTSSAGSGGSLVFSTEDSTAVEEGRSADPRMVIDEKGNVGIGTVSPSAPLEVDSTTGGVIMPRMTTTQMNAISSPTDGEMIYNTTANKFYGRANGAWTALH